MMSDVDRKLEAWKKHLIDLGKRNPLINLKTQAKSALRFTVPSMMELWDLIVSQEQTLRFDTVLDNFEEEDDGEQKAGTSFPYGDVETNHPPKEVQRILRTLRKKAKTFADEQGINVLYMTFGIIEWKDTPTSVNINRSPLVLVPVSLTWESINSPICLSMIDDEILLNPAITHKFAEEFNSSIPEFSADEGLASYFERLKQYSTDEGFTIKKEVYINILSFTKISIYNDIEKHRDGMVEHPLIRALSGDGSGLKEQESYVMELGEFDHDAERPNDVFQIVDADSSQQDAISYAKCGISYVLQGPPGTGKSQTITNIIAEQIAAGKKVLFVSEKKAALDVVFRRLKDAGLADFCFILHDTKANKKTVVEQLRTVMEMSSKHAEISEAAQSELEDLVRCRDALNDYANELNEKIEPLKKSVFQANGEISALDDIEDVIFSFPNVIYVNDVAYRSILSTLNRLKDALGRMRTRISDNPWRNSVVSYATQEFRQNLNVIGTRIEKYCSEATQFADTLADEMAVNKPLTLDSLYGLSALLRTAGEFHYVPAKWFKDNYVAVAGSYIQSCKEERQRFESKRSDIRFVFEALAKEFTSVPADYLDSLSNPQCVSKLRYGLEEYIRRDPFYSVADQNPTKIGFAKNMKERTVEYNAEKAKLLTSYADEILSYESAEMLHRFEVNSKKLFKFLNSEYREDKRAFLSMRKNTERKYTDREAIVILRHAGKINAMRDDLVSKSAEMSAIFPIEYSIDAVNLDVVSEKIDTLASLQEFRRNLEALNPILSAESDRRAELESVFGDLYKGFGTDWEAVEQAIKWTHDVSDMLKQYDFRDDSFIDKFCGSESFATKCVAYADGIDSLKDMAVV